MDSLYSLKDKIGKILNNKTINSFLIVVWLLVAFFTIDNNKNVFGRQSQGVDDYSLVQELNDTVEIKQRLKTIDGIDNIGIKFATYARKNSGNVTAVIKYAGSDEILASETFDIRSIQDNAFKVLELSDPLDSSIDKQILITLSSDSQAGKGIGVYYSIIDQLDNSNLYINNRLKKGDLTIRLLSPDEDLKTFSGFMIPWILITTSILILLYLFVRAKQEIMIPIIVFSVGLIFMIVMTPLSIPDEQAHYEFAFQKSNYMMGASKQDHLYFDSEYQKYGSLVGHANTSQAYKAIVKKWNSDLTLNNQLVKIENDVDDIYNLDFIVPGLGITLGRLLKLNFYKTFYLGRLFNLMFYTLCTYIALRKTPIHKTLYGLLMIMPMFLQQAASYSYDCFVNGLSFIVIAYFLKFYFVEEDINIKEVLFITFICSILAPAKAIYSFFTFLFWLVPYRRYGSKRKKIIFTLLICVSAIYQLLNIIVPVVSKAIENVNELCVGINTMSIDFKVIEDFGVSHLKISIGYMVRHPLEILMIVLRTIRYNIKIWFYDSLGRTLSGLCIILPIWLVHIMTLIPVLAALKKEKYVEPIYLKIILFGLCAIIGLFTIGGMLMTWTDLDQTIIEDFGGVMVQGIQGRYFSPLLAFVFPILNNKKINIPDKLNDYLVYGQLLVLFQVLMYVVTYTFIN